jgi:hypothetical protein
MRVPRLLRRHIPDARIGFFLHIPFPSSELFRILPGREQVLEGRDQLDRLVRYLVRPPLALDRLTESTGGQLLYQFRRPWSDGSTALLLEPLELLERLAALVPPPHRPLLAYHERGAWPASSPPRRDASARPSAPVNRKPECARLSCLTRRLRAEPKGSRS